MIEAIIDEVTLSAGTSYSRRPRIRALDHEIIAKRKSDAVVCALCRKLIEAGHNPSTPMVVRRGETIALRVRSIGEAAKLTVSDVTGPPRFVRWQPMPDFPAAVSPPMRENHEGLPR